MVAAIGTVRIFDVVRSSLLLSELEVASVFFENLDKLSGHFLVSSLAVLDYLLHHPH